VAGIDRRHALKLLGGLGAAGLISACGGNGVSGPEPTAHGTHARVGLLVPGTGGYKQIGDDIINGVNRYLRETGNRLGGHPVVTELVDEGDSPEAALAALEDLLARDVHAIIGVANPSAMMPVSERVEEEHVPLLGANASPEALQGTPHVWRTSYVHDEPGLALGRHLVGTVQGQVAIIAQEDPAGADAVLGLREAFLDAGATDLLAEPIYTAPVPQPSHDHFDVPLRQVRDLEPEAVFCCYLGDAAAAFIQQYVAAGLDPAMLYAPAYLTEGAALSAAGEAALGIRTAANYAPELRTPANRAFVTEYQRDFGEPPTIYSVAAYDAAAAIDKALVLSGGDLDPQHINTNLARIGLIDSPRGRWQFNQGRTPTQKWYLRQVSYDGPILANLVLRELGTLG
jgi:branched-chain amino acid transport system substrate-binding protein